MRAKRIMANLRVADIEAAKGFYTGYLGLSTEEFNMGWVARYTSPDTGANVQLVTRRRRRARGLGHLRPHRRRRRRLRRGAAARLRDRAPDHDRTMGCAPVLRPSTGRRRHQHRAPPGLRQPSGAVSMPGW